MLWSHSCSPEAPNDIYSPCPSLSFWYLDTAVTPTHFLPSTAHSTRTVSSVLCSICVCLNPSYTLQALGRNNFPSPSFIYFSDPKLGWEHSGHSLLNKKWVSVVKKFMLEKKNGDYVGWKPKKNGIALSSHGGQSLIGQCEDFSPPHIRLFSSNREIQNVHLVGERENYFYASWYDNKRLKRTLTESHRNWEDKDNLKFNTHRKRWGRKGDKWGDGMEFGTWLGKKECHFSGIP